VSPDGKNVYAATNGSDAVSVFSRNQTTGALTQLAGTDGCVSETGTGGACAKGSALDGARYVTVSPDGKNVYVASYFGNAVAIFSRNETTGALTQLAGTDGCISETGTGGACADGTALNRTRTVAVSPDGKNVYVASQIAHWGEQPANRGAVSVFSRDQATGALTQLPGIDGCVSETGTGGACTDGTALARAFAVIVSPDGKNVYVASFKSDAVSVFTRNQTTGALTQLPGTDGCVSETGSGGACTDGAALDGLRGVAVDPGGRNLYVAAAFSDAVTIFSRDETTGVLTQLPGTDGCVSESGTNGACASGTALDGTRSVTVSPDGESVYVGSFGSSSISVFSRD
jgi:DNA-binding beta-propeller fold protein YncE